MPSGKESSIKPTLSTDSNNTKRAERLNLNYHLFVPHLALAEYKLESENLFNSQTEQVIQVVREMSLHSINESFKNAGYEFIDADRFVKEKNERFVIYASTTRITGNIVDAVMQNHELPHKMLTNEITEFLINPRIKAYKELWIADKKRQHQEGFIAELPQKVFAHWKGEEARTWEAFQFNLLLSLSLNNLNLLLTTKLPLFSIDSNTRKVNMPPPSFNSDLPLTERVSMIEEPTKDLIENTSSNKAKSNKAKSKFISQFLMVAVSVYLFIAFVIFIPYYNWKYAQENGFANWFFLGEVVPTAKAVAWPYFAFFAGTKEIQWTEEEQENYNHLKTSINAYHTMASLSENIKPGSVQEKDRNQVLSLSQVALQEAQQVSDQLLMKIHPKFKEHFRNEYQKGLEQMVEGLQSRDVKTLTEAQSLCNKWSQWANNNADDFHTPRSKQ